MAKPSNDIGDRDYGRRTYASNKKYEEQRKLASDAEIDRIARRKHSEYKKPYIPDQSYPEMEMYNIPWTPPVWPRTPPDDPTTTTPGDPGGPIPPVKPIDPRELPPFLGCMFFSRRLMPRSLKPGEIAYGGVDIGNQDSIKSIHIYGPGILGTDIAGCNASNSVNISGYKPYQTNKGFCGISVKAKDNPNDFNHVSPYFTIGKDAPGPYPIVVEVTMASGAVCTENIWVETCPADIPLEWNEAVSATTLSQGGTCVIAVKGGMGPFSWAVTGTDVSLRYHITAGRYNTLMAGYAFCGTAEITVTDACEEVAQGDVLSNQGSQWTQIDPYVCLIPGPYQWYTVIGYSQYWREVGGKRCCDYVNTFYSGYPSCDDCAQRCADRSFDVDTCDMSSPDGPCAFCITNVAQGELDYRYLTYSVTSPNCLTHNTIPNFNVCLCNKWARCWEWKCT